jgi:hypothetical protein
MPNDDAVDPTASHSILDKIGPKHPAFTSRAYRVLLDENERLLAEVDRLQKLVEELKQDRHGFKEVGAELLNEQEAHFEALLGRSPRKAKPLRR